MRGLGLIDLTGAARALLVLPEAGWGRAVAEFCAQAHCADKLRRRRGRGHPLWGNGTLYEAAMRAVSRACGGLPPEPPLSDPRYLAALGAVIRGITLWRARET